jgi:hypothetical protein
MAGKAKPIKVSRDAGSGKFVTDKYAKSHPKTTEKENYKPKK